MSKVSVCIPVYNQVEYLKKTIDSVLRQTYTDYEIIITDDSPGTMVKDFVEQYKLPGKIKYFKNIDTLGSPENWNEAVRKASGEYIKILHHDDWLNFDDSLAKYVQLLDDNPLVDFAISATQEIFPSGNSLVHEITVEHLKELKKNPLILYNDNVIGAPSTTIIRRNAELRFDPNLKWLVDIEFYLRQINNNSNIAYSTELLVVTFLAEGRVSDECEGNKEVEVYEYLYLLEKIYSCKNNYIRSALKKCLLHAINICKKYKIKNLQDVKDCGYNQGIHRSIKTYLLINNFFPFLARWYLSFLIRI